MNTNTVPLLMLLLLPFCVYTQHNPQLEQVNEDIWKQFTKAFESQDIDLFKSIHAKNLVRVAANTGQVKNLTAYIQGYKDRWPQPERKQTIQFRFFERIYNEDSGSERGIYKFTIHPGTENEESYYGKFHVIVVNKNNQWKLMVDYDSNENNSIDENTFKEAFALDDYERF